MIIALKLKNWMSFRDKTSISFVASDEKRLKNRVPQIWKRPTLNVSPIAFFYGGNASGKTNLFAFFSFIKFLVLNPIFDENKQIRLNQFKLTGVNENPETEFDLTFLSEKDTIYTLHVVLSRQQIIEESLAIEKCSKTIYVYRRHYNEIELCLPALEENTKVVSYKNVIKKNQLFLAMAGKEDAILDEARNWFAKQLKLMSTLHRSSFNQLFSSQETLNLFAKLLEKLDTGICQLDIDESSVSALPPEIVKELQDSLNPSDQVDVFVDGVHFLAKKENEKLIIQKIISFHKKANDKLEKFDLWEESEGTLRLFDILPAFLDAETPESKKVYILDEWDRSWHYLLSKKILETYLSVCSKASRSQMLLSTHDLLLMDQEIFRRGEMFLIDRDENGASTVCSLNIPGLRYDKDLRKMYLQGKLGGIPNLCYYGPLKLQDKKL